MFSLYLVVFFFVVSFIQMLFGGKKKLTQEEMGIEEFHVEPKCIRLYVVTSQNFLNFFDLFVLHSTKFICTS